ncbi:MAG: hypothetical protein E6109_05975 [Ruminococcus sp.]|nr:hypothetical protein [Ruminococcus sp.]
MFCPNSVVVAHYDALIHLPQIVTHILRKAFFRHALAGRKHTAKRECKQAGRQEQINF